MKDVLEEWGVRKGFDIPTNVIVHKLCPAFGDELVPSASDAECTQCRHCGIRVPDVIYDLLLLLK